MCLQFKWLFSGDLDSIKILVENGVDYMVGNDDMRTVIPAGVSPILLYPSRPSSINFYLSICFVQAAHLAASNGMISILDFLLAQASVNASY